jgi:hypothetical protein
MFLANTDGLWSFIMIFTGLIVIFGIAFVVSKKSK